jgi:hypothetical protein
MAVLPTVLQQLPWHLITCKFDTEVARGTDALKMPGSRYLGRHRQIQSLLVLTWQGQESMHYQNQEGAHSETSEVKHFDQQVLVKIWF